MKSRRTFQNLKLTKEFHLRYFGVWIALTVLLLVGLNAAMYFAFRLHWRDVAAAAGEYSAEYAYIPQMIGVLAGIEVLGFSVAIVVLAKVTAHRIAGPFIRLRHVFDAVAEGDFDQTLKFRDYDKLEKLEASFDAMMRTVRVRVAGSATAEPAPAERPSEERVAVSD